MTNIPCSCFLFAGNNSGEIFLLPCEEVLQTADQPPQINTRLKRIRMDCGVISCIHIIRDGVIAIGDSNGCVYQINVK